MIQGPAQIALALIVVLAIAVAAMFYAMAQGGETMANFITSMVSQLPLLIALGNALMYIAGALVFLGASGVLAAIGLAISAVALAGMFAVMTLFGVSFNELVALGDGIHKVGVGMKSFAEGLASLVDTASELSNMSDDSFIAITKDGGQMNMVMASSGVMRTFSSDTVTVDVKLPEVKSPKVTVKVYLDSEEIAIKMKEVINDE